MKQPVPPDRLLKNGLKTSHLRLLAALLHSKGLGEAAAGLNITQPAASRLMTEIERIAGVAVHERTGRGMRLTPAGAALAQRAQRVQIELRDAARDIDAITAGLSGHVRIGSVTGPAIERVLPAITTARRTMPAARIDVVVAPSDQLTQMLADGKIDFAIGRLPESSAQNRFDLLPLADEPVDLLVRRGHPLAGRPDLTATELLAFDWVMQGPESLMQRAVIARLHSFKLAAPHQHLTTTSFLLTLALLQNSDAIAPLARAVTESFSAGESSPYACLSIDLGIVVETYGLITLKDSSLTPLANSLAQMVTAQALPVTAPLPRKTVQQSARP